MKIVKAEGVYYNNHDDSSRIAYANEKWYYVKEIGTFSTGFEDEWYWRAYGDAPVPDKIKLCESGSDLIDYIMIPDKITLKEKLDKLTKAGFTWQVTRCINRYELLISKNSIIFERSEFLNIEDLETRLLNF